MARQFGGTGRVLQSSLAQHSARSFSCGEHSVISGADFYPAVTSEYVGETNDVGEVDAEVSITEDSTCAGEYVGTGTDYYYEWVSYNTSIATIPGGSGGYGNDSAEVQGVSAGTATIDGIVNDGNYCQADAEGEMTVTDDQTPIITGISPSTWIAGGPATGVTLTGQDFGSNVPTLTFSPSSGISYTVTGHNDSTIEASITVASGTPNEDVSVSVTNNGYGGNSFAPVYGSGGEPAESTPATAFVSSVPIPTNFRVDTVNSDSSGNLTWVYYWDSSISGADVSDLTNCSVREYATYPGLGNFNWTSPPYDTSDNPTAHPTITPSPPAAGTLGGVEDQQLHPGFMKPYVSNTFTATQVIQFSCTNYQSGAWQNLSPFYSITRTVSGSGSTWTYTVTKDGHNASVQLP